MVRGGSTTTRTWNDAVQLLSESTSGGTLNGLSVNATYDSVLRRSTVNFKNGSTTLGTSTYGYDTASRLASVTDGTYSASYSYLANSPWVDTVSFKTSGTTRLTAVRQYDRLNRLLGLISTPSSANQPLPSYQYQYNAANQRVQVTLGDGSYWVYQYDALGQVISGKHYWNDGRPVPGQQYEYGFDDIGNRTGNGTKLGGDASGANLRSTTYTRNLVNQYTSRTTPTGFDVLGLATASATVTVNGSSSGVYRRGEYFRKEVTVSNASAPVWQSLSLSAGGPATTGYQFVPLAPETFGDPGNLTAQMFPAKSILSKVSNLASIHLNANNKHAIK